MNNKAFNYLSLMAGLGIDVNGMIEKECNKAKYRAAARQASYREKEEARKAEFNKRFERGECEHT